MDMYTPMTPYNSAAVLVSWHAFMDEINMLTALCDSERQELRVCACSYFMPLFFTAYITQATDEKEELRRWYNLPEAAAPPVVRSAE